MKQAHERTYKRDSRKQNAPLMVKKSFRIVLVFLAQSRPMPHFPESPVHWVLDRYLKNTHLIQYGYLSRMKRFACGILFLIGWMPLTAQVRLSPEAQISVITCGPDTRELYAAFGHSAIRVYDPANGLDEAFNYGVFNFNQPNFYLNFAKGFLYYKLGVYSYPDFEAYYLQNDRYVHEQVLRLTADQKERLFQFLIWNAQPENQNYRYQYYQNNCASKIRDVLETQLGDAVQWDSTFVQTGDSFRDKTDEYLDQLPWGDLGIDICLGLPIDRTMYAREFMFLPDYVEQFVDHAKIRSDSGWVSLVADKRVLDKPVIKSGVAFVHPWIAFGFLFAAVAAITLFDWKRKQLSTWLDVAVFGITGLIGCLLLALWMFTDHQDAARNFNLLWAFPLHLVGAVLAFRKTSTWAKKYFQFAFVLTALLMASWWLMPQALNPFLVPVAASILARAAINSKLR
jgi:hypothetical protein